MAGRRHDSAVTATLSGLLDRLDGQTALELAPDERLDGRTCLVTGANRGLGLPVAVQLAQRGARMVLACRSGLDGAVTEVRARSGARHVSGESVDLGDLRSVDALADRLADRGARVDALVLNAGVVTPRARKSAQGVELQVAVNYLANVRLVDRLSARGVLPLGSRPRPRVVLVSSESHRSAELPAPGTTFTFEDYGAGGSVKVYGRSKLLLQTWGAELARRLGDDACVLSLCPGAVRTDIAREAPAWTKPLLFPVMRLLFRDADEAAVPVVHLACARDHEEASGRYLHVTVEKPMAAQALDPAAGARLWDETQAFLRARLGEA